MFTRKKSIKELKLEVKYKKIGQLLEAILKTDIDIHYAPISQEYFIVDKVNNINVALSTSAIKITNHKFLYEVNFNLQTMDKYMALARTKVEEKANRIKNELFKNEIGLIDNIKELYTPKAKTETEGLSKLLIPINEN